MREYKEFKKPSDKKLMRLFINCPDYVRRVVITDNQIRIIKAIRNSGENSITTKMLSVMWGISLQSASAQLTKLWQRGYLTRCEIIDQTGGIIYRYKSII